MSASRHETRARPRWQRPTAAAIVLALVGAGIYLLARDGVSVSALAAVVRRADPWWLGLAVACAAASYLGYALIYQAVTALRGGPRIGFGLALQVALAALGATVIATAAGRLGVEYWSLRKLRLEPGAARTRVLALNVAPWAVLAAIAGVGATALLAGPGRAPLPLELAWVLALPVCLLAACLVAGGARRRAVARRDGRLWALAASVVDALVLVASLRAEPRRGARALAGSLVYWGGECLVVWTALRAFGVHLGAAALVVGYATGYLVTMLPLPAAGVGGVEAAGVYGLTLVGVPVRVALLAVLVQRACTYWLPLLAALVAAQLIHRLGHELAAADRDASRLPAAGGPARPRPRAT